MQSLIVSTGVVALAEIGDKTQLLAFLLAARFKQPLPIILGILTATLFNHGLAGALGAWVTTAVNPAILRWALGLSFLGMAIWTLIPDRMEDDAAATAGRFGVYGATLMAFFLAEMGDKTQIATVALAAHYGQPLQVIAGTTLGMLIADVPAVFIGERLADRTPMKLVRTVAAAVFAVLGIPTLLGVGSAAAWESGGATPQRSPEVRIDTGRLTGDVVAGGVLSYKGIAYAAPPTGARRWQPPQPAQRWRGVRAAEHFGARCMQRPVFADMVFRSSGMSEDCLFLNVWSPVAGAGRKLPVLVYFYGGGFMAGDGSEPRYDGASLAAMGLVTVTVNYRLNLFGFFAHPELTAESPQHASGNYGLLDQSAALHWVRRNIAAFGGDPARVTVAGESAGSFSVSALMASPLSRQLIAGAIGESGSVLGADRVLTLAEAEAIGRTLGELGGAPTLAALRALPAEQILALSARPEAGWPSPVIDGYFLPKSPAAIYAAGDQAHIPLLAGANNPEVPESFLLGDLAPTLDNYRRKVRERYGEHADEMLALYPAATDAEVRRAARQLASDSFIVQGTWKWVDESARARPHDTYYYRYDKPRPASKAGDIPAGDGAVHSGEIEYALGNLHANPVYAWTAEDEQVSGTMQGYFANFIRAGNPNGGSLPYWPAYASGKVQVIDVITRAEVDDARGRHQAVDRRLSTAH